MIDDEAVASSVADFIDDEANEASEEESWPEDEHLVT